MPLRMLTHRLKRLECVRRAADQEPFRVLIHSVCGPVNLATSTCSRTAGPDGQITEVVWLDGSADDLPDSELERFIASFPVERHSA